MSSRIIKFQVFVYVNNIFKRIDQQILDLMRPRMVVSLPTFRDNVSVPTSRVKEPNKKLFSDCLTHESWTHNLFPKVGRNLHSTLRIISKERTSHLHSG
jgi:hypothetical protein